ncbi:IS701 family transposase [Streptomyces sp. enrichment culture]|uniref:IS701 family transposase n=1 Tax=Streptomyces sp. enrichment culture TaxID=1795815 RepID=UPI003F549914
MSAYDACRGSAPAPALPVPDFAQSLFAHLARADQRRWAEAYLMGLLTTPGKKSVRRLAAAVSSSPTALQQFLNASPWAWEPARRRLTQLAGQWLRPHAWVLAMAVLPKRGEHSVGVHRSFIPAAGRVVNCQQGLGAFVAADGETVPVDWRLVLPAAWADDGQRRLRARIPAVVRHRTLSAYALDLVDTLRANSTLPAPPVVADMSECSDPGALLQGLGQRRQDFVIAVPGGLQVLPAGTQPRHSPGGGPLLTAQQLLQQSALRRPHTSTVEDEGGRLRHVRAVSGAVHLPGSRLAAVSGRGSLRLFTECRSASRPPTRVWITNLVHDRMDTLLALTQSHTWTKRTMEEMTENYGLLDFEGRSFPGWHHHMTLVSAAYAYRRMARPTVLPRQEIDVERIAA